MKKSYLSVLVLFVYSNIYAQTIYHLIQGDSTQKAKKSFMYIGLEASTTAYINPKTNDSNATQLYTSAYIDYYHSSGLGIALKTYLLTGGSNPGFYLTTFSAYYGKFSGKVVPYISYTRMIYHDNPSVPASPIQNELYGNLRVRTKIIDPIVGIDWGIGEDKAYSSRLLNDFTIYIGATHIFAISDIGKNGSLAIVPSIQVNASTDRYYKYLEETKYISQGSGYSSLIHGRRKRNMGNGNVGMTDAVINPDNNFALSNVAVAARMLYFFSNFSIEPAGCIFFPIRGNNDVTGYWQINFNYFF